MAGPPIALVFLARGRHPRWADAFRRFAHSYRQHPAGREHRLYVVFKGFVDDAHLKEGEAIFAGLPLTPLHLPDDGFDIGAYRRAAELIAEPVVCFFNTKTELIGPGWLAKLARVFAEPDVGVVGATGSFQSLGTFLPAFPAFPNPHVRTNAFMVARERFLAMTAGVAMDSKYDGLLFESGPNGMTRQILREGLRALIVGADGRGYEPWQWPLSETYRSASNANALIADDDFRKDALMTAADRTRKVGEIWRIFLDPARAAHIRALVAAWSKAAPPARPRPGVPLRRNDPCSCGSGVRFKLCHGNLGPSVRALIEDGAALGTYRTSAKRERPVKGGWGASVWTSRFESSSAGTRAKTSPTGSRSTH